VIAKSDLIILVAASSALAVGIVRWHQNTQDVSAITIPASATSATSASSRVVVEPVQPTSQNTNVAVVQTAEVVGNNVANTVAVNATAVNTAIQTDSEGQIVVKTIAQPKPVVEVVVAANSAEPLSLGKHQVQSGDYLGKIAGQYGTDVQTLRELNNISGSVIQIGQEILYPL